MTTTSTAAKGRPFPDVAAERIFLIVMTLRDPKLAVSKLFSLAQPGFAYRPTGLFVIPFALSFAIVLVTTFSLARHVHSPRRIAPFHLFVLPDDHNRRRRALLAGRKLLSWGALVFSCLTIVQLFCCVKYGRLASGLLTPRLISDIAFFILWSTAFILVISAHHTLPLLRATSVYDPPRSLARPLLRPFTTTATIVTLPLLVLAALASAVIFDSDGILSLHSAVIQTARLFADAASSSPSADNSTTTILGPDTYAQLQSDMSRGWTAALRGTGSAVKACALVVLLIALFGVEIRAYSRYWQLSKNARREERRSRYSSNPTFEEDSDEKTLTTFRPASRQSGSDRQHAFVPTLPFHQPPPASLPMCRTATRSSTASCSSSSSSSSSSIDIDIDDYDLRSATRSSWTAAAPRYADSPSLRSHTASDPSSTSTHLAYRDYYDYRPRRSDSIDDCLSLSIDDLSHDLPPPLTPDSPPSRSPHLVERAYVAQHRQFEKYELDRPRSVARRPGRQASWEDPGVLPPVAMIAAAAAFGTVEERRTCDTLLPGYASRAGSSRRYRTTTTKHRSRADDEEEFDDYDDDDDEGEIWDDVRYDNAVRDKGFFDDVDGNKVVQGVSRDMVGGEVMGRGYAGPSARCLKAMMHARLGDAMWSAGTVTAWTLLFVVKAVWAQEILSSRRWSFLILILEHTLPSVVLCVYLTIAFCRRASARIDAELFKQTRWGRDLNDAGWFIPSDETERESAVGV